MIKPDFLLVVFIFCLAAGSVSADQVTDVLSFNPPPDGVVFEIVEADETRLVELLPKVQLAIRQLREKFPQMQFAVVSHGREEFALQSRYQNKYAKIHLGVKSLVEDNVPVHVCETHAGWYGVTAEDFPDYVDVAPTGPGQISAYQELDYHLIVIE
jgi:intracellular sulfur oxidation DsrE/DsrF family protein